MSPDAATAHKQDRVVYYPGATTLKQTPAVLQWVDHRVQLMGIDAAAGAVGAAIFDADLKQVSRASVTATRLSLTVDGQRYNLDFNPGSTVLMAAGGMLGLLLASRSQPAQQAKWWGDNLRAAGVEVRGLSFGLILGLVIGIVVLIAIVIITMLMPHGGASSSY